MPSIMNNFVVNVGHISNECDVIAGSDEPAPNNVKCNPATNMTNVRRSLNCRATQVYPDFANLKRDEVPHGARRSVINA